MLALGLEESKSILSFEIILAWVMIFIYPGTLYLAFRQISVWHYALLICAIILYILGYLEFYVLFIILFLAFFLYSLKLKIKNVRWQKTISDFIIVFSLLLGFHLIPGFGAIVHLKDYTLSNSTTLFNISYSTDKALAATLLLGFGIAYSKFGLPDFKTILISVIGITIAVLSFAIPVEYLTFDMKFKWPILIWAYGNLFITCIAEEAFFRGFIQHHLYRRFQNNFRYAKAMTIFITSLLFSLAHFSGGLDYMVIAFIAGIGYGIVYAKNNNLLDAILVHFLANLVHISLFTYPRL